MNYNHSENPAHLSEWPESASLLAPLTKAAVKHQAGNPDTDLSPPHAHLGLGCFLFICVNPTATKGFLGDSDGKICLHCGRCGFKPWVGKIP